MPFDAFVSYSSTDKVTADACCAVLESAGVRCWIAPRDVRPGTEYGEAIIDGIDQSRLMVLIFSSSANKSRQIHREIEHAVNKGIPIIPLRIEEVAPTKSMEYFIGAIHWLDALTPPIEKHLQQLSETVKVILQVDAAAHARLDNLALRDETEATLVAKTEHLVKHENVDQEQDDASHERKLARSRWVFSASAIGACVFIVLGGLWVYQTRVPTPPAPSPQLGQPVQKQPVLLVPETVPFIRDRDREAIRSGYLPAPEHKALAISVNRSGFITGQQDDETAKTAALMNCKRATEALGRKNACEIYAVGNNVVFTGGNPPMPPPPWLVRNPVIERPFTGRDLPLASDSLRAYWEQTYPSAHKAKALALGPAGTRSILLATPHPRKPFAGLWKRAVVSQGFPA